MGDVRETITRAFAATVVDPARSGEGSEQGPGSSGPGSRAPGSSEDPGSRGGSRRWGSIEPVVLPDVGDVVGNYRLLRVLGVGNFGRVYVAERVDVPEHMVALKLLPRSHYAGRNVERELVMLATVGHPNVVQLKDHGATEDYVWLTMPVYEGETLEQRLDRGPLGFHEAHDIFVPIARGLEALHAAGLRHQDIKPENLFLARFGGRLHPILLDLGVAAEKDATFVAGTALFAAPEQLVAFTGKAGAIALTEKMDIYCLGTTVLLALVGSEYFPGWDAKTRDDIAGCHAKRAEEPLDPLAIPEIQGAPRTLLEENLRRWLALAPEDRPSMKEMAEQLDVLLEPQREAEREEERARERERKQLFRTRLGGAAALFAALALGAFGYGKRETLQLAAELEEARAAKEQDFGNLEVCTASYGMARRELVACVRGREQEGLDHQQRLAALAEAGGESCDAALAERTFSLEQKHKKALDVAEAERKAEVEACTSERARVVATLTSEREELAAERAELEVLAEQRSMELAALQQSHSQCMADRASCLLGKSPGGGGDPAPGGSAPGGAPGGTPGGSPGGTPGGSPGGTAQPGGAPPGPTGTGAPVAPPGTGAPVVPVEGVTSGGPSQPVPGE